MKGAFGILRWLGRSLAGWLPIVAIVLMIEFACQAKWLDRTYFPPPIDVGKALVELFRSGELVRHLKVTLARTGTGYGIAMAIAIPVGLLMGEFPPFGRLLGLLVELLRPMPSAAVIPVAILLFGIEDRMKVIVIVFGSVWPTLVSAMDGVRGVDPVLIDTGRLLQFGRIRLLRSIVLPAALPSIVTGMRISLAIALILAITAEMIAGSNGLGYFILDMERAFSFKEMFAGIIVVGVIGYLASRVLYLLDRWFLSWYYAWRERSSLEG